MRTVLSCPDLAALVLAVLVLAGQDAAARAHAPAQAPDQSQSASPARSPTHAPTRSRTMPRALRTAEACLANPYPQDGARTVVKRSIRYSNGVTVTTTTPQACTPQPESRKSEPGRPDRVPSRPGSQNQDWQADGGEHFDRPDRDQPGKVRSRSRQPGSDRADAPRQRPLHPGRAPAVKVPAVRSRAAEPTLVKPALDKPPAGKPSRGKSAAARQDAAATRPAAAPLVRSRAPAARAGTLRAGPLRTAPLPPAKPPKRRGRSGADRDDPVRARPDRGDPDRGGKSRRSRAVTDRSRSGTGSAARKPARP